ncbi:MAG: hypothetical protein KAS23_08955, partial [Anaerohalosphaera sp.]|nr:hypothetical protein [Anaerohalosphaera sp.]
WGKGDGDLKTIDIDGIGVGGMICHDDNFTKMTRRYGRSNVGVVALPTADWTTVRKIHMQSSTSRAIESRYAIVRGAANGISAVISAKGKVLDQMDHYTQGPGYVIANVNVYDNKTIYSLFGDWIVAASGAYMVIIICNLKLKRKKQKNS